VEQLAVSRPSLCVECHVRWRQDHTGLCRQCKKCLQQEQDDRHLAEHRTRALERQAAPPRPRREVVVNGRRYEITFDGT
jgi:hypothetical protein